ncbi:MogA/MoaB family molybdenum cofactor biosynthesis protein [Microbacterium sp. CFH 31415]|uniref:MogA/MoaB family molybdenum cofactor biosynthesis protein n=1 Tax=Microbacterium sp. CFH 31415 TaxID=2921732 RepID=UPI001F14478E|nr:MogA/MoaB family molybdenum cofactor biosynthesis protein [Microbacterium sp. CFH 31415]MCH6229928.1 MogA/MoaB family molybdenum cofactor biosynthesis protein [Microbacterium sp. CFH 31415]
MSRAAVITVSDRSSSGERGDASGPVAVAALREAGFDCADAVVVPDGADSVERALVAEILAGAKLIVTSGGTGVGPRDETPEGTRRVVTREVPGIVEELRRRGAAEMPAGMLSRGVAGVADPHGALIVNLPGSPKGVVSGIPVVLSVARHVLDQLGGSDH